MECAVSTLLMWLTPFPHSHICSDCYLLSDAYLIYFDISHPLVLLFTVMFIVSHTSLAWQFYEGNDLCLFCVLVYTQNLKSYLTLSRGSIVASQVFNFCELKWTGMGKFNSDDHYIYYCGQESLRRNEVALIVNKRVWNTVLELLSRQTIQYHSNPSLCPNHQCWSWSLMVLWWSARPSRNNTKKYILSS